MRGEEWLHVGGEPGRQLPGMYRQLLLRQLCVAAGTNTQGTLVPVLSLAAATTTTAVDAAAALDPAT